MGRASFIVRTSVVVAVVAGVVVVVVVNMRLHDNYFAFVSNLYLVCADGSANNADIGTKQLHHNRERERGPKGGQWKPLSAD